MLFKKISLIALSAILFMVPANLVASGQNEGGSSSKGESASAVAESVKGQGFSWDMAKGSKIKVLYSQHPYAEASIKKIKDFEKLTGIEVNYSIIPEENYFDKLTTALNSRSGDPDVFMTGAYQVWEYSTPGYMEPLESYINNPDMTSSDYNFDDFFSGITGALQWNNVPGDSVGTGSQWALPLGFEQYVLAYNKRIFKEKGLNPPKTIEELQQLCIDLNEFDGKGTYALALRGTRNWATIHPAFITTFTEYGAKDIENINGKLVSQVNSKESVEMTQDYVDMIKNGGSPSWSSYTWYQASADFGAGKAAMLFDADCVEYFQNVPGASQEAGNLAWVPAPQKEIEDERVSNLWTWALGMNSASKNKLASWLFIQYFTSRDYLLWAAINANGINTPRKSVFNDSAVQSILSKADGYTDAFNETINGTTILFTPQPYFFELTTDWASMLQDLVSGQEPSVQAGLDKLKKKMDDTLSDVVL
jgi:multiple sugar transport system substrate-binding protein